VFFFVGKYTNDKGWGVISYVEAQNVKLNFIFRIGIKIVFGFQPLRARCTLALKQALCAPYSDTRLKEPCSFTKVPDGPYT